MAVRSTADVQAGLLLGIHYRAMSVALEKAAADKGLKGMPLSQRIIRQYALIARRAAYAEELDPEPRR